MLPKSQRLNTELVKAVAERGRPVHSPFFVVKMLSGTIAGRFSVSVPKKVAQKAVLRNVLRRRVYSAIRRSLSQGSSGHYNVLVVAKNGLEKLSFAEVCEEISRIFVKSGLLK